MALGAWLGQTRIITDEMVMHAAECLPSLISQEDLDSSEWGDVRELKGLFGS